MIAVILAGGSGTRLWPLSTPGKPKHLMSVTGGRTLLQDAYSRAQLCADEVYVVTDSSHAELVIEQLEGELGEEHIIIESDRRGTASCITLALAKLTATYGEDVLVGFMHADHHILDKEALARTVQAAGGYAKEYDSIALIGTSPSYPATGFGYIKRGEKLAGDCYRVASFEEKPDLLTAEGYLESRDYLWNMGLFAASVGTFASEIKRFDSELFTAYENLTRAFTDGQSYEELYGALATQAIEPAVIEKSDNVIVVPGKFDWTDIGSYKDLHGTLPKSDGNANSIEGEAICIDTSESIVMEQTGRPVAVLGLNNVVVISTKDGLLVCSKEYSQRVKEAAEVFNNKKEAL